MLGRIVSAWVLMMVLCVAGIGVCLAGDTTKPAAKDLESLWRDLLQEEPVATRAVLMMAKTPEETTVFLAARLKPLTLSKERLEELLVQLGSEKEMEWQAAYHELEYFDPRLAMGLEELMGLKAVQEYPARHRLVDVLTGHSLAADWSATKHRFKILTLRKFGDGQFNFYGSNEGGKDNGSWWAEPRVERLNTLSWGTHKDHWTRAIRALALLENFGTEEATAVIDAVAAGHPDAQPTKVANEMLGRLTKR